MRVKKLEIQELKFGKMQQPRKPRKKALSHETGEHSDKEKDKDKEKKEKEGVKMTPDERKSLILSEIISTEVTYIEMLTMAIEVPPPLKHPNATSMNHISLFSQQSCFWSPWESTRCCLKT